MDEIIKKIRRIDSKIRNLENARHGLLRQWKADNEPIPEHSFAKAVWEKDGRQYKGVVYVTCNSIFDRGDYYEVLPTMIKCEPIRNDDGTGKHYYSDYWEKKKQFIKYDRLISIEPYDAPMQKCGKCLWLHSRIDEEGNLRVGCSINLGRKTDGGDADACDRFQWWNWEQSIHCTHIEYIKQEFQNRQES